MKRLLLALAVVLLGACDLSTEIANEPTDPATETFAAGLKVDISTMTKTAAGTYYKDFKVGTGTPLTGLPNVVLSYSEFLKDASVVGSALSVTQSLGALIPGLQDGMQGMLPGGERLIVVPSALGYGNLTNIPGVPPNSTLVYDMIFNSLAVQ